MMRRDPSQAPPLWGPNNSNRAPEAGLPEALACAVLDTTTEPASPGKGRAEEPPAPPPGPAEDAAPEPEPSPDNEDSTQTCGEAGQGAMVAVDSPSAAEAARALTWLGVTYRPPDVWRERQPSLAEEWAFVLDGSHLPDSEVCRAAARGYAAPAIALISALHLAIWVLRSPARHATAWVVCLLVGTTAALML